MSKGEVDKSKSNDIFDFEKVAILSAFMRRMLLDLDRALMLLFRHYESRSNITRANLVKGNPTFLHLLFSTMASIRLRPQS